ncbi:MAG TPA: hypothetical protein VGN70_00380 [Gammaproteobacteria bacterium]
MSRLLICLLLSGVATVAAADAPRTGTFTVSFSQSTPLADQHEVAERLGMGNLSPGASIAPSSETWHVYVPEAYSGSEPYGVLVWVSPSDSGELPHGWQSALKGHKLIYVAADRSGNSQDVVTRRVPLALMGLAGIEADYKIDISRVYVGGFSGGGVTASHIAAGYADIFAGGLFVSTSHGIGTPDMPVPALERYRLMQGRGRYVFTAGSEETDNQIMTTRAVDAFRALCVLRVDYIHIANAGHGNLEPGPLERSLRYLDGPSAVGASESADCEKQLGERRAATLAAVRQALVAGDAARAKERIGEFRTAFGPLAEPEASRFESCIAAGTAPAACAATDTVAP